MLKSSPPWYRELTRYHWFVLAVAALGWMFDCFDQQLFALARTPAMKTLLESSTSQPPSAEAITKYGTYVTSIFLIGWASGGLVFGVLGDRIGRAKTMLLTILLYSASTGLSALSVGVWDFSFYRFVTGLGVGGEFAVGVALVAEVMPDRARPDALGLLQALSAVGNVAAAGVSIAAGQLTQHQIIAPWLSWRLMFVVGTVPALLAVVIRRRLKEPERWRAVAEAGTQREELGSYRELFRHRRWRRHALGGMVLASAGVIGLWGIAFFSPELTKAVFEKRFQAQGLSGEALEGKLLVWAGIAFIMQNIGGFFGMYFFGVLTRFIGRRPTFAIALSLAMGSTAMVFWCLTDFYQIFWMMPLMGFGTLSVFGGYAIYFPELFPTYLRSTGTSFCYNVGRFIAASGPLVLGRLTNQVFAGFNEPLRYAGVTMCAVFLVGIAVLPFLPETKGQPLPE